MTAQSKAATNDTYSYLTNQDPSFYNDSDTITVAVDWSGIEFGRPNAKEIEPGVFTETNRFSAVGFPKQNLESFYLIPLIVNTGYRMMYLSGIGDGAVGGAPPDCVSFDGVRPTVPLNFNGQQVHNCAACPVQPWKSQIAGVECKNRPLLLGLAYFPDHDHLIVPVRKNIPGLAVKELRGLALALTAPTQVAGQTTKLPSWARIVKVSPVRRTSRSGMHVWSWGFELLSEAKTAPDAPSFVPEHLIPEVQKFLGLAVQWARPAEALPQLPPASPMAALPGSVMAPGAAPAAPIQPEVVQAEESSDY